jgi:hypothetical protein
MENWEVFVEYPVKKHSYSVIADKCFLRYNLFEPYINLFFDYFSSEIYGIFSKGKSRTIELD